MSSPQNRPDDHSGQNYVDHGGFVSFKEFYERTFDALLARALLLESDREQAEEAVADTYVDACASWEHIEKPWGWALTVMARRLTRVSWRDRLRLDRERQRYVEVPMPAGMLPEERAEIALVMRAVAQLPRRERQAVILYYPCDLTQAEIAKILGISRGAVARYLSDAIHKLQRMLGATPPPARPGEQFAPRPAPAGTSAAMANQVATRLMTTVERLSEGSRADGRAQQRVRQMIAARLPRVWDGGQR